jgi:hypothetical protein
MPQSLHVSACAVLAGAGVGAGQGFNLSKKMQLDSIEDAIQTANLAAAIALHQGSQQT